MDVGEFINDNPNLRTSTIISFLGVGRRTVEAHRPKPLWSHSGVGIPFVSESVGKNGFNIKVRCKNQTIVSCSSLRSAMLNVDRLIYCLEHNGGKLPRTFEEIIFEDLEFIINEESTSRDS